MDFNNFISEITPVSRSTLTLSKDLEAKGFTRSQAEGLAEAIIETAVETAASTAHNLVTKNFLKDYFRSEIDSRNFITEDYLEETKDYLEEKIYEVRSEIKDLKREFVTTFVTKDQLEAKTSELRCEIKDLRTEVKGDIFNLDKKISGQEVRMVRWMIGLQLFGISLNFGFIYFLVNFLIKRG